MKSGILITVRLKSIRLPKKALLPLGTSQSVRPLLGHLVHRMRKVEWASKIVLCTSTLKSDNPLADFAVAEKLELYRGDPRDVLMRLNQAAETFDLDHLLCVTGDNPFVDANYLDRLLRFHLLHQNDYSKPEGLPLGAFGYAVTADALKRICYLKADTDTEVWGPYFTDTGKFRWGVMEVSDEKVRWPDLRLTVDTPEDFELAKRIVAGVGGDGPATLAEIVAWCRANPDAVALNQGIQQKPGAPIRLHTLP